MMKLSHLLLAAAILFSGMKLVIHQVDKEIAEERKQKIIMECKALRKQGLPLEFADFRVKPAKQIICGVDDFGTITFVEL